MTREDVLPEGAQVDWEETTWTRWTRDGKAEWSGTHYGIYAHIGGTAARIMDEVYHLRAQLAVVREAWKFVEENADLCDRGPLGEGWQSEEMSAAVAVLAALEGAA